MKYPETQKVSLGIRLWVTFGGSGLSPKAPGTMGSIMATLVAWPMLLAQSQWFFALGAVVLFFVSLPLVNRATGQSQTHDPGWIVIDEVCGQWLVFAFVPSVILRNHLWLLILGLLLFRFFDILKPFGIRNVEKLPGAWGIMTDDLLGGVYAGFLLWAFVKIMGY